MDTILNYFPNLTDTQKEQFAQLYSLYAEWNDKINVVSRKDIEELYERHVLHSLAIGKVITFAPGSKILDIGTGGGFPGIPLAILFPDVSFHLVDSIGKKIKVVTEVAKALGLKNVKAEQARAETINGQYDFIVSRAVTRLANFYPWVKGKFLKESKNKLANGILYLKGGDLEEEIAEIKRQVVLYSISDFFKEEFFETKYVLHIPSA
ncbi:16S rRNA (guanine(527)-N(7))-methyltransferase RsmG [Solitalea lacus]|uniref:16S rRNA (guanine(527)-N(7))-methyltransferase RsmG n=1 Tax=Solitalea lacus TaxID=2911172 RepID=UPI001EDC0EDC|nr:16S rRNA (guanine(527)-N(7))-methyltransferase RsmG [Solitalea lacus]UKJ06388.1 16S rRNA (guanine(527)-N(7))-methyltransferase RsmG [Solitalea lacus]